MPNLPTIHAAISTLPTGPPLVVAIVAGTTGIGSYVARAFARAFASHGAKLRIYIIGRNASRADSLLKYGRETSPGSDWRFVAAHDLSLMEDVKNVCSEVIRQEQSEPFAGGRARLDVLYMGQALSPMVESGSTYIITIFHSCLD
jgi:NAD(P)-dependent dehydrogenase (short-subunit alcohol dehydrogenase family)